MPKRNGNLIVLSSSATSSGTRTPYAFGENCSLEISDALFETTNKQSDSWSEFDRGRRSWTISADGIAAWGAVTGSQSTIDVLDTFIAGTDVFIAFGENTNASGEVYYSGQARIQSISANATSDDAVRYSLSLQGTGPLTKTTVS